MLAWLSGYLLTYCLSFLLIVEKDKLNEYEYILYPKSSWAAENLKLNVDANRREWMKCKEKYP